MKNEMIQRALTDLVVRYQEAGYFPSASVRVFRSGETIAEACVGDARPESLFDLASVTKIATATGILLMAEEGLLGLDDELAAHFGELSADPWLRRRFSGVTIRRLLTHTSSLPDWYPFYIWENEGFWTVLKSALVNQLPTEGMVYSDINFILLGRLLEEKRQLPLQECLREYIAKPLGVEDEMLYCPEPGRSIIPSSFDNEIEEEMCAERGLRFDHWRAHGTPVTGTVNDGNCHYYFKDVCGHAGLFATARALERLCQMYMNTDCELLRVAQREQPGSSERGLGFETGTIYPHGCGHKGFTGTSIYISREADIGAVALTNRLYYNQKRSGKATNDFRRALHEMVYSMSVDM